MNKESKLPYPKGIFFIVINEFCERFNYYGFRAVLTLYMMNVLKFTTHETTSYYHTFAMITYFLPIFGAIIADAWLGKYTTILSLSIVYATGSVLLAISAIPDIMNARLGLLLSLGLIAIGTGGIKPCVSAHGGDQFKPEQEKQLQQFFSFFYLMINLGAFLSNLITPEFRKSVRCFGDRDCYFLAFGFPAILMLVSVILFVAGRYIVEYVVVPPSGNVFLQVMKCIGHALFNRVRKINGPQDHWLDYANDQYDTDLINDVKAVLGVIVVFFPIPVFWALFDQQGSTWTLQAVQMDGQLGNFIMKPDQMQSLNPLLIILFIPIFEFGVYPFFAYLNIPTRPLQRMTVGMLLAVIAFIITGLVQMKVNSTLPVQPNNGKTNLQIINTADCDMSIMVDKHYIITKRANLKLNNVDNNVVVYAACVGKTEIPFNFSKYEMFTTLVGFNTAGSPVQIEKFVDPADKSAEDAIAKINIIDGIPNTGVKKRHFKFDSSKHKAAYTLDKGITKKKGTGFDSDTLDVAEYTIRVISENITGSNNTVVIKKKFKAQGGAAHYLFFYEDSKISFIAFERIGPNTVSLFWQVPQYVVITTGEILVSITGLEFAYSEAPKTMKSVLQSIWLLTVSFGNLLVVLVALIQIKNLAIQMFVFGSIMLFTTFVFIIVAYFYKSREVLTTYKENEEK